uniref:Predicted Fe-S oxidoreductases n=1 Tax=uncultured SAR11 cluster alpha proteobacterium H17925_38M03 TaxID=715037 RepID=E7C9Y2_9PROT|nr:predicted Fe-S oxidoreductases [uncultured SAR11 cluster alpha proteobacterium H17925_38M03]
MSINKEKIIGIGCDFQLEPSASKRKDAIENFSGGEKDRIKWMLDNMRQNKAFIYKIEGKKDKEKEIVLKNLQNDYLHYRKNWKSQPKNSFEKKLHGKSFEKEKHNPLCFDLEVASVCDLACGFCYRQYVSTPDKIMKKELAFKLIDQASNMQIPSMKFNWRGEPLLNPQLPKIVNYAKKKGILETIINTNATKLDEKLSRELIESGLDIMIYSFDGGTKETYEKMRPGRFSKNNFDNIYQNILNFSKVRKKMKSPFPRTKIQMILTDETRKVQEEFFRLFKNIVDEVSVKQYTERGGKLIDLSDKFEREIKEQKQDLISNYGKDAILMKDSQNNIYVSEGRLPCEQPFQRLLTTYDGKVGMCCYDWGATHTVGYLDESGFKNGEKEYQKVKNKADNKKKGFEMMDLSMPKKNNLPEKVVRNLKEIWNGKDINKVRKAHIDNKAGDIKICKVCPFKETYKWKKIN